MDDRAPRTLSRNSSPERERVSPEGGTPRVDDTLVTNSGAPDADYHPEALASAVTDSEAGALPDNDEGGIVPLRPRD
ncbi:hypothetical protein ACP4J4_02015 [Aureimonas ureilytica]|uniref:hypothetical protein n=1 Tax=Aureimonas ureilytica TaxID=401562 RepID=UPI003CE67FE6